MSYEQLPPCLILIDKEGRMFHQGAEMIHQGINRLLLENLALEDGQYIIEYQGQRCWVEVEDAPLVVTRVSARDEELILYLTDGYQEPLAPDRVFIGRENVLYTLVRGGRLPARFNRPAYYQLAEWIVETETGFGVCVNGRTHALRQDRPEKYLEADAHVQD